MTEETSDELECPGCGDLAAKGVVNDGDPLMCGCAGWVSVDAESDPEVVLEESWET